MSATKWLTTLVRARQLQEDSAAQQLAEAQREARRAHARAHYDAERIQVLSAEQTEMTVPAFVAAAVALQAAAATHAAAVAAAVNADAETSQARGTLLGAAQARHSAEKLQEQAVSVEQLRLAAADQRTMDELAAGIHRRSTADQR